MRVLILAAGLGTRLKPITNKIPKCLVQVGKKSLLEHWLEKIENTEMNISEVFVNLFYKKEMVERFLKEVKTNLKIKTIIEDKLEGTGGTFLKLIHQNNDQDLLVIHCDNFYDDTLNKFLEQAKHKFEKFNCDAVILVFRSKTPEQCVTLEINKEGKILKFWEKIENPLTDLSNGAIYLFSSQYLKKIINEYLHLSDIAKDLLEPNLANFFCYETKSYFCDIGNICALEETNIFLQTKVDLKKC